MYMYQSSNPGASYMYLTLELIATQLKYMYLVFTPDVAAQTFYGRLRGPLNRLICYYGDLVTKFLFEQSYHNAFFFLSLISPSVTTDYDISILDIASNSVIQQDLRAPGATNSS